MTKVAELLTPQEQRRIAQIRANIEMWSAETDTSTWEAPFLLGIIDRMASRKA